MTGHSSPKSLKPYEEFVKNVNAQIALVNSDNGYRIALRRGLLRFDDVSTLPKLYSTGRLPGRTDGVQTEADMAFRDAVSLYAVVARKGRVCSVDTVTKTDDGASSRWLSIGRSLGDAARKRFPDPDAQGRRGPHADKRAMKLINAITLRQSERKALINALSAAVTFIVDSDVRVDFGALALDLRHLYDPNGSGVNDIRVKWATQYADNGARSENENEPLPSKKNGN